MHSATAQSAFDFDTSTDAEEERSLSTQERFERYHARHPEVYALLVKLARQAKEKGLTRYSMDGLFHVLRWHYAIGHDAGETFKLNNIYTAYYSRLVEAQEGDLRGFFEQRVMKRH